MASILVVCSGNICRSPIAEGLVRRAMRHRLDAEAPDVTSAGTIAVDGNRATPEAVMAAAELGVDIRDHRAHHLDAASIEAADLILCMTGDHRTAVARLVPAASGRAFTLKELVRLLERVPGADPALPARVAAADAARHAGAASAMDDDVADPIGMPLETYRAVAWELDQWIERLADALGGPIPVRAEGA